MVGGVAEAVADGETGLLVPAGDPVALASAIGQMMRDPDAREVMGRAGRQRVERSFRADDHARRVEELYGELLGVAR
jgi:glycosyltransferase involved in cell wall biosynthesis